MQYIPHFLDVMPYALAVWRNAEAAAFHKMYAAYSLRGPYLDVGCGFGEFMSGFAPFTLGCTVDCGVDIDKKCLTKASKSGFYSSVLYADARNLQSITPKFQTVFAVSVLEHIPHAKQVFPEVFRLLQPGGYFVFSVPTISLNSLLWQWLLHPIFSHQSKHSKSEWLTFAQEAGFRICDVQGTMNAHQLSEFEGNLPSALVTQVNRLIFDKRIPFSPHSRVRSMAKKMQRIPDENPNDANIVVVAQKNI